MSIVPTTFRPRFVGGNLGSGINPSTLRKTQLVQFWLDQEYAGVTIKQVQGSPSYSGASAGIHGGPGDFQDFVLVDSLGRSPATKVWVACSAMFRLLDCLSYVRGNDVNADGRKDDTFAQHIHVGDREGSGKVYAALVQISQYLAHQNGLVGGRADLEATVNNPLTLATYTDRGFVDRYQSLSGVAFTLDTHTEPATVQEDDMSYVMSASTPTGQGFYLVTPQGRIGIGSMGQVDACLSALNARSTRTMGPHGWEIKTPYPCLQSEADTLEALEQTVRDRAKVA